MKANKKFDPNKVYISVESRYLNTPANDKDNIIIGYKGVGEAPLPKKMSFSYLGEIGFTGYIIDISNAEQLIANCIKEAEYVEFEEIIEENENLITNNNT
jgi:hypothetical protein